MANVLTTLGSRLGSKLSARYGSGRLQYSPNRYPTPEPRPYKEMGVSGTAVHGGYVQVKERSPEWIGRQKWITISELAINTSIVGAGVHYFLNLVAYPKWQFKPSDEDDEEAQALAEFCNDVINHMDSPWYKVVRRASMYRFNGFGVQEWTAKLRDDGLIGFKDIEARPPHTIEQWDIDNDGTVLGMWQRSPQTGAMLGLPRDKVLYLVEDTLSDSPEGIGMFRHMASSYNRLKQLQELEIRAYERDLRGIPIARAPLTMINRAVNEGKLKPETATRMINDMEAMVRLQVKQSDTGLILDSLPYFSDSDAGDQVSGLPQWGFELLSGAGVGYGEIAAAIERIQREMARIIGVEHLMMGDTGGNRALSEDKSRNLYLVGNSVLKYISSQVKQDLLVPLFKLNGFPMKKMPTPETEDITFKNADAITGALQKLASAGAPINPNDPVINDMRELMGISRIPEDQMAMGAPNPAFSNLPPELMFGGGKPGGPPNIRSGPGGQPPGFGAAGSNGGQLAKPNPFGKAIKPESDQESADDGTADALPQSEPQSDGSESVMPKPQFAQQNGATARGFLEVLNPGAKPRAGNGGEQGAVSEQQPPKQPAVGGESVGTNPNPMPTNNAGDTSETRKPDEANPAAAQTEQTTPQHQEAAGAAQQLQQQAMANSQGQQTQVSTDLLLRVLEHIVGKPAAQQQPQMQAQQAPGGTPAGLNGGNGATQPPAQQQGQPNLAGGAAQGQQGQPGTQPPAGQQPGTGGQPTQPQGMPGQLPQGMLPQQQPPPKGKEEMTIDRATEILSPFKASLANVLEDQVEQEPKGEELYDRLGSEKNVQAKVIPPEQAQQPPMQQPVAGQQPQQPPAQQQGAIGFKPPEERQFPPTRNKAMKAKKLRERL